MFVSPSSIHELYRIDSKDSSFQIVSIVAPTRDVDKTINSTTYKHQTTLEIHVHNVRRKFLALNVLLALSFEFVSGSSPFLPSIPFPSLPLPSPSHSLPSFLRVLNIKVPVRGIQVIQFGHIQSNANIVRQVHHQHQAAEPKF